MDLGAKIKNARLEAGLSQRQLCGDTITRNMLSLIESGRAKPSMDTLGYLAARLGKSIGYFLDGEAVTSPNQQVMDSARQAFSSGAYRQVLETLRSFRPPDRVFDPERHLLEALAALRLAEQSLDEGKNAYAMTLLDQAHQTGQLSPYYTPGLEAQRLLLLYRAEPGQAAQLEGLLPNMDGGLLLRAEAALQSGDIERCIRILDAACTQDENWCLLRGRAAVSLKDWAFAAAVLTRAENRYPQQCIPLLEQCYRELEDYKMAYFYACKQR